MAHGVVTVVFTNKFSEDIAKQKYYFGDENDMRQVWRRVAKEVASVEKDASHWEDKFYNILEDFAFVPGGRILSNAGLKLKGATLCNCIIDGFVGKDKDSIKGIYNALYRQAMVLKSEAGYGFCCDVMRPRGAHIAGIANQTPGPIKFAELWDKSSEVLTAGSGKQKTKKDKGLPRKGAMMITMSCWHPDIEEFITAKNKPHTLTKFNMSVLAYDNFMRAVEEDANWVLMFPDHENYKELYEEHWDGNLQAWMDLFRQEDEVIDFGGVKVGDVKYGVKIYKIIKARELWELIMNNAWSRNEPGIMFIDTINRMNNLWYCEFCNASNPCSEQCGAIHLICLLGSLNLTQFVDLEKKDWLWDKLAQYIAVAMRFMDNINDIINAPLPEEQQDCVNKRRIGMGVMGYASALYMLGWKYGDAEVLRKTDELMSFIANEQYKNNALLAKEKGSFLLYDQEKYLQSKFIQSVIKPEVQELIKKYGARCSHVSSCQPTGNTQCLANIISGGIEPIFAPIYTRTYIISEAELPHNVQPPLNPDFHNKRCEKLNGWKWIKEGDTNLLRIEHNGEVYKADLDRGFLKEEVVKDYAVQILGEECVHEDWAVTAQNLTVDEHIDTLAVFAKYIDAAISKTNNIPHDYPYEDFKECYFKAWRKGIKGYTGYREGTMASVLKKPDEVETHDAPDRPKEMPCDVHFAKKGQEEFFILVGLLEGKPYEVFAGKANEALKTKAKHGKIVKKKKGIYNFVADELEVEDLCQYLSDNEEAVTRLLSTILRYGGKLEFVLDQLGKVKGELHSFSKIVARTLSKYLEGKVKTGEKCPNCGSELVRESGCKRCMNCAYSVCQ